MKKILFKLIMPLLLIISCSGLKKIEKQLEGNWILTSVNNQPIELIQNTPTVQFEAAKKAISGTDGCNQYRSSFEMESKNEIRIAPLLKTKMMCVDRMILANQFTVNLIKSRLIEFEGDYIIFKDNNENLLRMKKISY